MRGQIVDKGRFVHAGYGMNALFGLQKQANSIYCRDDVDTGKRSASGNFAFIFTLKPRICGFIFNKIITLGELIILSVSSPHFLSHETSANFVVRYLLEKK
ncbi:hypothetical protein J4W06_21690, partial [Escherichia coli]